MQLWLVKQVVPIYANCGLKLTRIFGSQAIDFSQWWLTKLDRQIQIRIVRWLEDHIEGSENPRKWGAALSGELGTFWKYRVGAYRVIADIQDNKFIVEVVKVGKRGQVYKK